MTFAVAIFILPSLLVNTLGQDINPEVKTPYDDLRNLNVSCYPTDTCANREPDGSPGISFPNTCSCHSQCAMLGTCCIDSPYRDNSPQEQTCRTVNFPTTPMKASGYFMVHRCPDTMNRNIIWKNLCEEEWSNEDDLLRIAPVTSLNSKTTYKNYYCLRCHETADNFLFWKLLLLGHRSNPQEELVNKHFSVAYNETEKSWFAKTEESEILIPVSLTFVVPEDQAFETYACEPQIITSCSESWTDDSVRSKCHSYSATVFVYFAGYKNHHCALCNFRLLSEISCQRSAIPGVRIGFSFTHLIDINTSDGDKVGETKRCENHGIWDPYAKKCRQPVCALPGYVIKDGKCTKE